MQTALGLPPPSVQQGWAALCPRRAVAGELYWDRFSAVSRRDWRRCSGSILHFESTWDDQAVFFDSLGKIYQTGCIFRISVYLESLVTKEGAGCIHLTSGSFRNGICWLSLSQQRRRQLMSFADSSLKAIWILVFVTRFLPRLSLFSRNIWALVGVTLLLLHSVREIR